MVDAGDMFGVANATTALEEMLRAEYLLRGMAMCRYDVAGLGEEDFRFGEAFLAAEAGSAGVTLTAANLYRQADDQPYLTRTFVKTAGELTVGVIALVGDEFREQIEAASSVAGQTVVEVAMLTELTGAISELGSVDVVVLLAHMSLTTARELTLAVDGLDVVVVAHAAVPPAPPELVNGARLVTAGYDGKTVGRLRMEVVAAEISSTDWESITLDGSWDDDAELAALYQEYLAELASAADEIAASIPQEVPVGGAYIGKANCAACHPEQAEFWATTKHATAFATLLETNHDYSPACIKCHATGFGFLGGFVLPDRTAELANVQCEVCHGAAQEHEAEPVPGYGLEPHPTAGCATCHTAETSPEFDLDTYLAETMHPVSE